MAGRIANGDGNAPGKPFKYKHAKAHPCPPQCTPEMWDRIYSAADSRKYMSHGKDAHKSKLDRESGVTWELARKMLDDKLADGSLVATPSNRVTSPATNSHTSSTNPTPSTITQSGDPPPIAMDNAGNLSIADKVKSGSRSAKKSASAATSEQGSPAPQATVFGQAVSMSAFTFSMPIGASTPIDNTPASATPATPAEPAETGKGVKKKGKKRNKKGTAQSIKKDKGKGKESTRRESLAPSASAEEDSGSETDDGQVYCICRKGDNHSLMIECEGGCEEWYHASCVNVDPEDAKNLLEKYVCVKCEIKGEKHTLWKIMCRLTGCRKPARLPGSKYCSDEHRRQWGQSMVSNMPRGTKSTPGGALTSQQLKAILKQTSSAKEFHALGKAPKLAHPPTKFAWDKILNPEEKDRLVEIQNGKEELERRRAGFNDREKFVRILAKNVSTKTEELKGDGIKDLVCGYSNKLAMNEEELAVWCASGEGAQALETGKFVGEVCLKRGCGRHKQWMKMSIQDVNFERSEIGKALAKLQKEREGIYERAEIRAASTLR